MAVLIGTPVHACKDYALDRWLENVEQLQKRRPTDVLLVDNSPDPEHAAQLRRWYPDWRIEHLEIAETEPEARVGIAEERIRHHVLSGSWSHWFAWDCDVLIPADGLDALLAYAGHDVVLHAYPDRHHAGRTVSHRLGCALVSRRALGWHGFLAHGTGVDPLSPACWHGVEPWFLTRVVRSGGTVVTLDGVIPNIQHLAH